VWEDHLLLVLEMAGDTVGRHAWIVAALSGVGPACFALG
jgi:hypothetical protein